MLFFLLFALLFLFAGIALLYFSSQERKSFGVLKEKIIAQDTQEKPGVTLYAKSVPLVGRPDFLIQKEGEVIPVEIKTGKTPSSPYPNHKMQLYAYCLLVEETTGQVPTHGYIRYPNAEFAVAYTEAAKQQVISLVNQLLQYKATNTELHCRHQEHYLHKNA